MFLKLGDVTINLLKLNYFRGSTDDMHTTFIFSNERVQVDITHAEVTKIIEFMVRNNLKHYDPLEDKSGQFQDVA